MVASSAPQKRAALLTTTSSTGWSLVREALMILRTSAIAACCSRASASFFFRSASCVLAFVVFERRPVMRVRLFAPLRDKVTSSAQLRVSPFRSAQPRIEPINTNRTARCTRGGSLDHLVGALLKQRRHVKAERLRGLEVDNEFELDRTLDSQRQHFYSQHLGCGSHFPRLDYLYRAGRIPEHGDVGDLGNHFPEQLQAFPFHFHRDRGQPGDVAAGPRQARDEACGNRIADSHHDEGDCPGCILDRDRGGRAGGHNHLDVQGDQFGDQRGKDLILSLRPAIFDGNVAALLVAERTQPVAEWRDEIRFKLGGRVAQETNPGDFRGRLLRARHERPSCRAAEQRDELATRHSITSSASESRLSEILTPSAFAVFMLITSSNLTTCCTGKSAGFAPLRILAA